MIEVHHSAISSFHISLEAVVAGQHLFVQQNLAVKILFLSYIKPHGPVTSTTLARWVKSTLAQAGTDTTKFKAHSLRSASSSAAYEAGVALPDIMDAADWSTVSTFTKFYHKPVCKSYFAKAVLGQTEQRSLAVSSKE